MRALKITLGLFLISGIVMAEKAKTPQITYDYYKSHPIKVTYLKGAGTSRAREVELITDHAPRFQFPGSAFTKAVDGFEKDEASEIIELKYDPQAKTWKEERRDCRFVAMDMLTSLIPNRVDTTLYKMPEGTKAGDGERRSLKSRNDSREEAVALNLFDVVQITREGDKEKKASKVCRDATEKEKKAYKIQSNGFNRLCEILEIKYQPVVRTEGKYKDKAYFKFDPRVCAERGFTSEKLCELSFQVDFCGLRYVMKGRESSLSSREKWGLADEMRPAISKGLELLDNDGPVRSYANFEQRVVSRRAVEATPAVDSAPAAAEVQGN